MEKNTIINLNKIIQNNFFGKDQIIEIIKKDKKNKSILDFVYIRSFSSYFNKKTNSFKDIADFKKDYTLNNNSENLLRNLNIIITYETSHYSMKNIKNSYNMLDKSSILNPSKNPILDKNIEKLFFNIGSGNQINIDYLHKIILYKYLNPDNPFIPALVLKGVGGSGKGTYLNLLKNIFGEKNTLVNIGQDNFESNFNFSNGNLLIAEFCEISSNTKDAEKNLNKLKNMVMSEDILIEKKGKDVFKTNNACFYIITSNSETPLLLDSSAKGNRRFSIINSNKTLSEEEGYEINEKLKNKDIVQNYLAWLVENFPEVKDMKYFSALENLDKKELEYISEYGIGNYFWKWFYQNSDLRGNVERKILNSFIESFCNKK